MIKVFELDSLKLIIFLESPDVRQYSNKFDITLTKTGFSQKVTTPCCSVQVPSMGAKSKI